MRLLLTRPILDSERLALKLRGLDFQITLAPLIEIKQLKVQNDIYEKCYDLIIFTSKNAVRSVKSKELSYNKVFTIGNGTFNAAISKGFKNIENSDGSSKDLEKLFSNTFNKKKAQILHPTSNHSNDYLSIFFKRQGSNYIKREVYHVIKKNIYPHLFKNFLKGGDGIISIFSAKTAEFFYDEILKMNFKSNCCNKILVVISKTAAEKLSGLTFKKIVIIEKPNELCFIDSINKVNILYG